MMNIIVTMAQGNTGGAEALRENWVKLVVFFAILLILSPSPIVRPFVSSLRAAANAQALGDHGTALQLLETALQFEPSLAELHLEAAQAAFASGYHEKAATHLAEADRLSPSLSSLHCLEAEILLASGDPRAAFASWQEAPDGCSGSGAFLRRAARILIEHGEPVAAKEVLEAWVGLEPGNSEAHLRMGITISAIRPQDALDTLRFARELSREGSGLATALIETIEASALVGEPAYSLAQVGQALAREEEWQLAKVAFQNALALQPDYPDALAYLGLTLDKTGSDGSQQLQTAAASAPEAAFPNLLLGIHWRSVGNLRKAQDALETAAGLDPKDPVIMVELAATYLEMGQIEAAEAAYRRAIDLDPENPTLWLLLAEFSLFNEIEIETLGIPASRNAIALEPENPASHASLGYGHLLLGNLPLAQRSLARALSLDPERAATHYYLGLLRQAQGDSAAALRSLELAMKLDSNGAVGALARRALDRIVR